MEQLSFFPEQEHGLSRWSDPPTSHMAAAEVDATGLQRIVLLAIRQEGRRGLTNTEICERTGLTWNTATPRVRPLIRKGLVRDSGEKRPGFYGKLQIVWKHT